MLPDKTDPKWIPLVKGEIDHNFKSVSGSMIISRLSRQIKHDDSAVSVNKCISEAYDFFKKFENIFEEDIKKIFG